MRKILIIISLLHLIGCTAIRHQRGNGKSGIARITQFESTKGTLNWAHYDATKRGSMIYVDENGNVRVLAENPPDVAIQSITEISTKLGEIKGVGGVEAALKTQQSIAELGKRTAAVNMLRDALYRVNEMYYATVDNEKNLLKFQKELVDEYIARLDKNKQIDLNYLKTNIDSVYSNTPKTYQFELNSRTLPSSDLKSLIDLIISNVTKIAIKEAEEESKIIISNNNLAIEKHKVEQQLFDSCNRIFEDTTMTKNEQQKAFDECLKSRKN